MSDSQNQKKSTFPPQHQNRQPGIEREMNPLPLSVAPNYKAGGKLTGKTAIITGGDSGIGKSAAIYFAKEGADVVIVYLEEHEDAEDTKQLIESEGRTLASDDSSYVSGQMFHVNGGSIVNG